MTSERFTMPVPVQHVLLEPFGVGRRRTGYETSGRLGRGGVGCAALTGGGLHVGDECAVGPVSAASVVRDFVAGTDAFSGAHRSDVWERQNE